MKRPITVSSSTINNNNNNNNNRNSLTRNSILNTSGSNSSLLVNTSVNLNSNSGANSNGTIYYANNNNSNNTSNRNMMNFGGNGSGTTFTRPTFGNPVPMINNSHNNGNSPSSASTTTFIPPNFQQRPAAASTSANRPAAATTMNVEPRQQFIIPPKQTFQRPQFSTPSSTQKRVNNIPHSGLSTPKSGKKQPLHLVSCLSPTSTQLSTPNRPTQTPTTPVQTISKPNISTSSSNTSALYPFTSAGGSNNNSFISNNNSINNKPSNSSSHTRFVIPNNYKPQEAVSKSSNLSDSQKESEEIEKLRAEIEVLKGVVNKRNVENDELIKSKKEVEEQLLSVQAKLEENHHENSGMVDEDNDDFLLAVLDEIEDEKMKDDDKTNEEGSQNSQKEKEVTEATTAEETPKTEVEQKGGLPLPVEPVAKKISKKRIKWKNKNIADLQKDPVLHKALYKLLIYKGNSENNIMDEMDTDEPANEALSGKLWKAHRIISNDQSKMFLLLPILNSYLKRSHTEFDCELFVCTLETILKLVLESEMFRSAFIESFSQEISFIELKLKKVIQENGYSPHPLFSNLNIIIPESKKSIVKSKIRERKKYLHYYINSVPYQPDFIFDSNMDSIIFNPEDIPVSDHDVSRNDLLADLLSYFSSIPNYLIEREHDVYCTILEIVKTLAIWSPETTLINFKGLIDGQNLTIKNILGSNNVVLIQKSLELLTILVKSEKIRSLLQSNNILTRVSAFLNVEVGNTEEMLQCRRMILRLFHYLAFLCPDGISLLKEKHNDNNIVFDAMILLLRKELEAIALLEDFSNQSERIYLIRDIIVIFNHVSKLNGPIPYISPSLRLDYMYAKTTISIIREKSKFKVKFQLDEMK